VEKILVLASKFSILFIFFKFNIISSCTGTPPPTNPVFPPYGVTANFFSLQYFNIYYKFSVLFGRSIKLAYLKIFLSNMYLFSKKCLIY
jgi:hypothetical protein